MRDHLEELALAAPSSSLNGPRAVASVYRRLKWKGRGDSVLSFVYRPEVSSASVIWIQPAPNPSFLLNKIFDILSLSRFSSLGLDTVWRQSGSIGSSVWLKEERFRRRRSNYNAEKESIEAFGSKLWCGVYFYKYIMCSHQVLRVEWERFFMFSNVLWKHADLFIQHTYFLFHYFV